MKLRLMLFGALFLGLMLFDGVLADTQSDSATVDITISSVTSIELNTSGISFTGTINPMGNSSTHGLTVTNVGSSDVNNVYAQVNTGAIETANPRGGASTAWSATNFLGLKNTTGTDWRYVGKQVWNTSAGDDALGYTLTSGARAYGDLWVGGSATTNLFYWDLKNGSVVSGVANCNSTGSTLMIQGTANNKNTAGGTSAGTVAVGVDWGVFSPSAGPLKGYCVAAHYLCTKLYVYQFDHNTTGSLDECTNIAYSHITTINPDESITWSLKEIIPPAVAAGGTTQSTLTVYASSV